MNVVQASSCRLSGEPLADADLLFEIADCPLPGIYPTNAAEASALRSPLRVVQARESGLVQLAHTLDPAVYRQYAFAGGGAGAYRRHLEAVAAEVQRRFAPSASILEVGCGDGWLVRRLRELGYTNVIGIDPGRAASEADAGLLSGYFPQDVPPSHREVRFDLVLTRHVLEHIETPRPFVRSLVAAMANDGELWIEVPDLDSAVDKGLWTNFYQLHCSYYSDVTLDRLAATCGLSCIAGAVVDVFGGSLFRRYVKGAAGALRVPARVSGVAARVGEFRRTLAALTQRLPAGAVGYGAAERTAVTLGFAPALEARLATIYDGNKLLHGRFMAGTSLPLRDKELLFQQPPVAVLLFATSNRSEILQEWRSRLSLGVLVAAVGLDAELRPLSELL